MDVFTNINAQLYDDEANDGASKQKCGIHNPIYYFIILQLWV
jgi:hypothetical protein